MFLANTFTVMEADVIDGFGVLCVVAGKGDLLDKVPVGRTVAPICLKNVTETLFVAADKSLLKLTF